jgi:type IV pilus assembly protein PilV
MAPVAPAQPSRQHGFTLIEVMIAVVVLSLGLLGVAALQLTAKKSSHQAWQRAQAVLLADSLLERVRINPSAAASYHTGIGTAALGGATRSTPARDCSTQSCSAAQMATWDLWNWERRLDGTAIRDAANRNVSGLVDPHGCVVFTAASASFPNTGQLRVIVSWRGTTDTSDAVTSGTACGPGAAGAVDSRHQVIVNTYVIDERGLG